MHKIGQVPHLVDSAYKQGRRYRRRYHWEILQAQINQILSPSNAMRSIFLVGRSVT